MPYVITTKNVIDHRADMDALLSRVAVATLDEARSSALARVRWNFPNLAPRTDEARSLPESGGTVGPLPDGTIIEVSRVNWADLPGHWTLAGDPSPFVQSQAIAAFNAS